MKKSGFFLVMGFIIFFVWRLGYKLSILELALYSLIIPYLYKFFKKDTEFETMK